MHKAAPCKSSWERRQSFAVWILPNLPNWSSLNLVVAVSDFVSRRFLRFWCKNCRPIKIKESLYWATNTILGMRLLIHNKADVTGYNSNVQSIIVNLSESWMAPGPLSLTQLSTFSFLVALAPCYLISANDAFLFDIWRLLEVIVLPFFRF